MGVDLESSVKLQGKWVTKIIHFVGGENGSFVMVNDKNVLMIEIFKENKN